MHGMVLLWNEGFFLAKTLDANSYSPLKCGRHSSNHSIYFCLKFISITWGGRVHCNPAAFPCMVLHHYTDIMCMSSLNSLTEWPTVQWWVLRSKARSRYEENSRGATVQLSVYNLLLNIWGLGQSLPDPFQNISGYTLWRVRNAIDNRWGSLTLRLSVLHYILLLMLKNKNFENLVLLVERWCM